MNMPVSSLFLIKASLLSELLYEILENSDLERPVPQGVQESTAAFLGIAAQECTGPLIGLLWLSSANPALQPIGRFFAGFEKLAELDYLSHTATGRRLLRLLMDNAGSLDAQLESLVSEFAAILSGKWAMRARQILNYAKTARFQTGGGEPLPGAMFRAGPAGGINRSHDSPWMRNLVLLAKIVPLWLADLAHRYQKNVSRLDEIPEEEIRRIAEFGVNGIWLVGLWKRSPASARIKTLTGGKNFSSAYSVFDYEVADEWGGETALINFRRLCERFGIRLGCDMVPNHTGIDSRWLREHPDWFMQVDFNPFEAYTFNGENLSTTDRHEIRIEDHYYDKTDASVVFALDRDGRRRYVYHGNDGTGLPWNDTAQLDHTNPAVRKALIDTALRLSENFSIIRFDAAMTLTLTHYRRLWFPHPDEAPAIASRAIAGMSDEEFAMRMPEEFWAELVAKFRLRQPDTLLIAEAFWMTEMFFVRHLGMHRVYNSAFMHSLRDEKNREFGETLRGFAEYDSDTLSRFVNYLSTPDEESATHHFPQQDKYFGAMTLMATLPGLPLLAPGQLEGYAEKYSMDQESPFTRETPDQHLQQRFLRQITPLLRMRHEFAWGENLKFPPCSKGDDCIVYEAGASRKFLVLYNNSYHEQRVTFAGGHFLSFFPGKSRTFAFDNILTGDVGSIDADAVRSGGYTYILGPYAAAVLGNFRIAEVHIEQIAPAATPAHSRYPALERHYAGVAVPVASLRSKKSCGIGDFSDLKLLIDWCKATEQTLINLLPVNDTGTNSSPYSALSAMALHPIYLDLDALNPPDDLREQIALFRNSHRKDERTQFSQVAQFKDKILREMYARDRAARQAEISTEFSNEGWVQEYAVYKLIKYRLNSLPWFEWPGAATPSPDLTALLQEPNPRAVRAYYAAHAPEAGFYVWLQFHLDRQLASASDYAAAHGVYLKGDMPIMLERDSVDVWLHPELFNHRLRAGAPPDMFSPAGQNWGFPVYRWDGHRAENFSWWRQRIGRLDRYFAAYRIDHVLGFFRIWCINEQNSDGVDGFFSPSQALTEQEIAERLESPDKVPQLYTAGLSRPFLKEGQLFYPGWDFDKRLEHIQGLSKPEKDRLLSLVRERQAADTEIQKKHGFEILSALRQMSGMLPCAEDLGVVPEYVGPALQQLAILSLKVYRWQSEGARLKNPRAYPFLSVATSSVHDSSNLREWLETESSQITGIPLENGRATPGQIFEFLRALYESASMLVIIPIQDLLALDGDLHGDRAAERINIPGTVSDFNWTYRLPLELEDLLSRDNLNETVRHLVRSRPGR